MQNRRGQGFTLLELLVAISIFSVLGLGSYQLLQTVSASHERVRSHVETYGRLNMAIQVIQRDFNQFVPRAVRDEYGEPLPPLQFDDEDYVIELSRSGWTNPTGRPRSEIQRVAYSLDYDTEELTRHFWLVLDRAEDSEPVKQVLLTGVSDFRVMGLTAEDDDDDFSLDDDEFGSTWPLAVEVTIATDTIGEVTRTFQLVDTYVVAESAAAPETDEGFDPDDDAGPDLEPNPDPINPGLKN